METLRKHPLIELSSEDVRKAREFYGLKDIKQINESLDAIQEWGQKQEHLKEALQHIDRNLLERFFILARGSVEGTKIKLDKLLTYRNMMPDLCLNRTVDEFETFSTMGTYLPLPKLSNVDQSRVLVTQLFTLEKLEDFDLLTYFRYSFWVGEFRLQYDYCISERFIIDLSNFSLRFLTKFINPVIIKKAEILCTEGFGTKIKGIHLLNAPSYVDRIVLLLKQGLKEKVANRIHVHNSYADLHKHIPKDILPKDFDGDGPSISKLAEQWKEIMKSDESIKIMKEAEKWVSDESKRSSSKFNEEYLGMPGSFRKLDLD